MKRTCLIVTAVCFMLRMDAQNVFPLPSGNVGIGTTNPQTNLHIASSGSTQALIETTDDGYATLQMRSNNKSWNFSKRPSSENDAFWLYFDNGAGVVLPAYMTFHADGNVGIGTDDTKGYRLAVAGSAIFTSVKVKLQVNWPDYVFQKDYTLRPLSEVEKFIYRYQHLPDVPSAADVAKDGVDLGDNQKVLLKKIEELTLYLIELNKKLDAQAERIKQLEQK